MSKAIKISDSMYELLEETAFKNGVKIQHLADEVLKRGVEESKNSDSTFVMERGRSVKIHW